jgi:hypothetical protein
MAEVGDLYGKYEVNFTIFKDVYYSQMKINFLFKPLIEENKIMKSKILTRYIVYCINKHAYNYIYIHLFYIIN